MRDPNERIAELLEAANRYLLRARDAEAERDKWRGLASAETEALQAIGEEFGVHGGEPRVAGIRRVLSELRGSDQSARDLLNDVERERDEARQIVRDIFWMALRYADGRKTYAVGLVNAAVGKGYNAGWLVAKEDGGDPITPRFARDGGEIDR